MSKWSANKYDVLQDYFIYTCRNILAIHRKLISNFKYSFSKPTSLKVTYHVIIKFI